MNRLNMKRIMILGAVMALACTGFAQEKKEQVMTKEKDTYVIRTESICEAKGYKQLGKVPLVVTVKKNKIEKVEALPNKETPKYFIKVSQQMLPKFAGLKFEDYATVDGVTGATLSSVAVTENMKAAYEYYKKNK